MNPASVSNSRERSIISQDARNGTEGHFNKGSISIFQREEWREGGGMAYWDHQIFMQQTGLGQAASTSE
jgi:hypothetical protein